jgi:hypothetical protein
MSNGLRIWFFLDEDGGLIAACPDYPVKGNVAPLGLEKVSKHLETGLPIEVTLDNIRLVTEAECDKLYRPAT